jgi:hypothetical protein
VTARLTASRRAAFAAAALFAGYPYFVWQSAAFNGAPFTAALLAMALLALDRSERAAGTVLAGAAFGALAVTRVSFVPLIACGTLVLARRTGWPLAAAFAGAAMLVVAPWLAATWHRDGGLVPPRAGMNLYLSACESGRWIPGYDLDVLIPPTLERLEPTVAGLTPARAARAADRLLFDEAVSCAAADPLVSPAGSCAARR